jgi:hypothetical protein
VYGVAVEDSGAVDEAATAGARAEIRAVRLAGARPAGAGDDVVEPLEDAVVLHPVCDSIEAVATPAGERRLRCGVCRRDLGPYGANPKRSGLVRELGLDAISPHNARCLPEFVLREYCCPGCATAFAADVARRDEPMLDELALGVPG